MEKVILGLGSNIGNRVLHIKKAIKELSLIKGVNVIGISSLYQTEPWGLKVQRNFLNCVVVCLSKPRPEELHKNIKKIEKSVGRKKTVRWGPREIDVDILFFGNHIIKKNKLEIPHPMIKHRNFVLIPLNEMLPGFIHPVLKKKITVLLELSSDRSTVRKYK